MANQELSSSITRGPFILILNVTPERSFGSDQWLLAFMICELNLFLGTLIFKVKFNLERQFSPNSELEVCPRDNSSSVQAEITARLFHNLNPLYVYWSGQPRVIRRLTSLVVYLVRRWWASVPMYEYNEAIWYIWVRSRRCGCLVTWVCYQMVAKPGNKTVAPLCSTWSNQFHIIYDIFCFTPLKSTYIGLVLFKTTMLKCPQMQMNNEIHDAIIYLKFHKWWTVWADTYHVIHGPRW